MLSSAFNHRFFLSIAVAIGIAFHIQPVVTFFGSPIHLSLSDLVMAFALTYGGYVWLVTRHAIPRYRLPYWPFFLVLLTVVMSYGLFLGFVYLESVPSWSLVKYLGWFVLLGYMGLGGLLVYHVGERGRDAFVVGFVYAAFAINVLCFVYLLFLKMGVQLPFLSQYLVSGLTGFSNAYGFLIITALLLQLTHGKLLLRSSSSWLQMVVMIFALVCLLFSGARSALLAFLFVVPWLFIRDWRFLQLFLLSIVFATLVVLGLGYSSGDHTGMTSSFVRFAEFYGHLHDAETHAYEGVRLVIFKDAFSLWQNYPFFGSGLGHFLVLQKGRQEIIHNSFLWILTEFGVVGAVSFLAFFIMVFVQLYRLVKDKTCSAFALASMFIFVAFAVISLLHEVLYQRYLWFIMGMALVESRVHAPSSSTFAKASARQE